MLNRREISELITEEQALDFQVMQKILPRIQGSSFRIRKIILEIIKALNVKNEGIKTLKIDNNQLNADQLTQFAKTEEKGSFWRSTEKLIFMFRRFEEDGFTSFWL